MSYTNFQCKKWFCRVSGKKLVEPIFFSQNSTNFLRAVGYYSTTTVAVAGETATMMMLEAHEGVLILISHIGTHEVVRISAM